MSRLFSTLQTYHARQRQRAYNRSERGKSTVKNLLKTHKSSLDHPLSKYGVRRWIRSLSRSGNIYGSVRLLDRDEISLLHRSMRSSKLLDYWYPQRRKGLWSKLKNRRFDASIPHLKVKDLSLHSNPRGFFRNMRELAKFESSIAICRIDFEDEICRDLAAFMVLSEFWDEMLPVFIGGKMNPHLQKVLTAVDLHFELKISLNGVEDLDDVWAFPIYRRRSRGATKTENRYWDIPTRDSAGDKFCDALELWLNELGYGLSEYGRSAFYRVIGELLENAERHSDGERRDGSWSISGFMARQQEDENSDPVFRVNIGIVSIGDTFYESHARASDVQKENVATYLANMRLSGASQSEETLVTLACLQDGVTCVPEADDDDRGGYGLMEMVELICRLAGLTNDHPPEITIVSGDSCVQMRHPYHEGVRIGGADRARRQWFNVQNSAKHPPDSGWVFDLPEGLPGTVVSISFVLDPEHLDRGSKNDG